MNRKIILVFVLTVGLLPLLGINSLAKNYCGHGKTYWYSCPVAIPPANIPDYYGLSEKCGCNNGTVVDCSYSAQSGYLYQGVCEKGTRQRRTWSIAAFTRVCPEVGTPGTVDATANYGSWTNISGDSTFCPKECTNGKKQYQIVNCTQQTKTCCNGYWSAWNQSCAANGYLP